MEDTAKDLQSAAPKPNTRFNIQTTFFQMADAVDIPTNLVVSFIDRADQDLLAKIIDLAREEEFFDLWRSLSKQIPTGLITTLFHGEQISSPRLMESLFLGQPTYKNHLSVCKKSMSDFNQMLRLCGEAWYENNIALYVFYEDYTDSKTLRLFYYSVCILSEKLKYGKLSPNKIPYYLIYTDRDAPVNVFNYNSNDGVLHLEEDDREDRFTKYDFNEPDTYDIMSSEFHQHWRTIDTCFPLWQTQFEAYATAICPLRVTNHYENPPHSKGLGQMPNHLQTQSLLVEVGYKAHQQKEGHWKIRPTDHYHLTSEYGPYWTKTDNFPPLRSGNFLN